MPTGCGVRHFPSCMWVDGVMLPDDALHVILSFVATPCGSSAGVWWVRK